MYLEQKITDLTGIVQRLQNEVQELRNEVQSRPITAKEAAAYLGVCRQTLLKRIKSGAIPFHKDGKKVMFTKLELDNYLTNN